MNDLNYLFSCWADLNWCLAAESRSWLCFAHFYNFPSVCFSFFLLPRIILDKNKICLNFSSSHAAFLEKRERNVFDDDSASAVFLSFIRRRLQGKTKWRRRRKYLNRCDIFHPRRRRFCCFLKRRNKFAVNGCFIHQPMRYVDCFDDSNVQTSRNCHSFILFSLSKFLLRLRFRLAFILISAR